MNDYGFTAEDDAPLPKVKDNTAKHKKDLKKLEDLIIPLLTNLYETADKPTIKWPNRGPLIKELMDNILKITRGST